MKPKLLAKLKSCTFVKNHTLMKLVSVSYSHEDTPKADSWELVDVNLLDQNLIVGRNATGKSRLAQMISSFSKMISQSSPFLYFGNWDMQFVTNSEEKIRYKLNVGSDSNFESVNSEEIYINDKLVLTRDKNSAKIFSNTKHELVPISPPDNKLVIHVRRDKEEFPFLEFIAFWAEQTYGFKFGNITPYSYRINKDADRLTSVDSIPNIIEKLHTLDKGSRKNINSAIDDFNSLGYNITDIKLGVTEKQSLFLVLEKHLQKYLPQNSLSQGMYRSLALLLFVEFISAQGSVSTVIIDDLCEGLDYERAIKLGKLIFKKFKDKNIQLIATTNDSFLMDSIGIKNWNILIRESNKVTSFNYKKNEEIFEKFKYSGLSNFDFFSSDYLNKK